MYFSKATRQILLIILVLIVGAAIIIHACHYSSTPMHGSSEIADTSEWVNNAGDITESIKADPAYFEKMKQEIIDSVAKVYKTTPKKIIEYVVIHEHGESNIPHYGNTSADYVPVDTNKKDCPPQIKSLTADFVNPYDSLHVKIAAPGSSDSSYAHKFSTDTLTMLGKWVKEGNIFHRTKKLQFDFSNANPDNKIYIDQVYRIYEKPKKWGVGAQAGVGFFGSMKPTPYLGIGISYSLINF